MIVFILEDLKMALYEAEEPELEPNWPVIKGQIISKCLFGVFNFLQKTNKNMSHSSKNEFIHSFFGRIHGLQFWLGSGSGSGS